MLDLIRNHKRLMLFILVILVFPAFALMGVYDYAGSSRSAGEVARVGGVSISTANVKNRMDQDSGLSVEGAVQNLIFMNLFNVMAQNERLLITDAAVGRAIRPTLPEEVLDANGQVNLERYQTYLQRRNFTPNQYEESWRSNLMLARVQLPIQEIFVGQTDVDQWIRILGDTFVVRQQMFEADQFLSDVEVSEDDLRQYYDQHLVNFTLPERVNIEYVVLDARAFAQNIPVTEQEAREYYEQNRESFERRMRASHILIEIPANATAEQKADLYARAQQLLQEVRENPARFAEIAKANSQDPGSASIGGDLNFFERGRMVEPFDTAAFALVNEGDISDVVETSYGYHIIMRTSPADVFENHRAQIEAQIRNQLANQQFAQAVEGFRDSVYVNRDSLEPVAAQYGLTIQHAQNVTQQIQPDATGVMANPEFLAAIFSQAARDTRQNIQAIEMGTQLVSARVVGYTPVQTQPFEDVEEQVRQLVVREKAVQLAQAAGREMLAQWQQDPSKADEAQEVMIPRVQFTSIYGVTLSQEQLPQVIGVEIPGGGYLLARVDRIDQTDAINSAIRESVSQQVEMISAQAQQQAMLNYLWQKYDVKVFEQAISELKAQ